MRRYDRRRPAQAWEEVLASLCRLQEVLPSAVVAGATESAIYAQHRFSLDHDHVMADLRERFDAVLADLEAVAGWEPARVRRPSLIWVRLTEMKPACVSFASTRPRKSLPDSSFFFPSSYDEAQLLMASAPSSRKRYDVYSRTIY